MGARGVSCGVLGVDLCGKLRVPTGALERVISEELPGMLDCVLDYECKEGGHYLSRYVCYYLGGRERGHFGVSDARVFPMSQT